MRLFLIACGVVALVALIALAVEAHDDAGWIEQGGYTSPKTGEFCCGVEDCYRVEVKWQYPNSWWFINPRTKKLEGVPESRCMESEDDGFWVCLRFDDSIRCCFRPSMGS